MKYARKPDYKKILFCHEKRNFLIHNKDGCFYWILCKKSHKTLQETFGAFRGIAFEKSIKQAGLKKYAFNFVFSELQKLLYKENANTIFDLCDTETGQPINNIITIYPHPTKAGEFANIVTVKTEVR